ncbi:MAG: S-adenosylmethionine:tRNA ribosyltransferase-isomerase [Candidatus Dormibacteria bacterium]
MTPFTVGREAGEPPEARGLRRDQVRLMVSAPGRLVAHAAFEDLPRFLESGDLLVVNTSGTWPAALDTTGPDGAPVRVHLAGRLPGDRWLLEPREPAGVSSRPATVDLERARLPLAEAGSIDVIERFEGSRRLWVAKVEVAGDLAGYLARWARPIRYGYVTADWPIEAYQTVFGIEPGSAEMPSAGRPFSHELISALVSHGVTFAPLLLHTGVSSLEGDEAPYPEWFRLSQATAALVNLARREGRRVIAVGTTVVRAIESASASDGEVRPAEGWTSLLVTPERGLRAVDALITGLHDPRASHLKMLAAFAPTGELRRLYAEAREAGYLWHEFGDSHLILRNG